MNIKKWLFKNWLFIFIFLFFLYINFLSPIIGDDWDIRSWFSTSASGNILTSIKSIFWCWLYKNGRGLSNFLMSYFCYYKMLWNFVSAGMFVFIISSFSSLLGYNNKKNPIALSILFLLSISDNIRMETYSLVCANIAFMVPLVLILIYLKIIRKHFAYQTYKIPFLILISLFCMVISTLMENISAGFTATLALLNLYIFLKTKKINKLFLLSFIFSLLGSIFMFTSPGMHIDRGLFSNSLSLFEILKSSLFYNIKLIIFENNFIFFIITLITATAILTNSILIPKKAFKYIYLSFLSLVLILLTISFSKTIPSILLSNNFFLSLFWLLFLFSFIIPILYIKINKNYLFLFFIAIFSLIPASLITQTGARIIMITVFIFIGIGCGILNQIEFNSDAIKKIIFYTILFGLFVQVNKLSVMYLTIYNTQKIRLALIKNTVILQHQQLWNYDNTLIIPAFNKKALFYTSNPVPINTNFHFSNFIKYYQLNPKTKIIFE